MNENKRQKLTSIDAKININNFYFRKF